MKTKYIFLSTLVLVAVAYASAERTEFPSSKGELVKMIRERDAEIADLKQERDKLLKEQEQIAKLRFEINIYSKALMNANVPLPDLAKIEKEYVFRSSIQEQFKKPLSVGQVAYLEKDYPKVQQVLDEQNMLVALQIKVYPPPARPDNTLARVYKNSDVSLETLTQKGMWTLETDVTIWIKGVSTAGLTDGSNFATDKPFVVKRTKKDSGGNTVFVLEPVKVFPE